MSEWQITTSRRDYPGSDLQKEPEPSKINKLMPELSHIFIYISRVNDKSTMLVREICSYHTFGIIYQLIILALKDDTVNTSTGVAVPVM